jgi:putative SOS response-associated peptidase YedK
MVRNRVDHAPADTPFKFSLCVGPPHFATLRTITAAQAEARPSVANDDGGDSQSLPAGGRSGRSQAPAKTGMNVAPSDVVDVIRPHPDTGELQQDPLTWGLVPRWTRSLDDALRSINARAETVQTTWMFKDCCERRRCLVLMGAFYEWQGVEPPGQTWAIARQDGQILLVAGIWDGWRDADGTILRTFAIITTEANATVRPIHHRMPVCIPDADVTTWLGDDPDAAASLLLPAAGDYLKAWPVSPCTPATRWHRAGDSSAGAWCSPR